MPWVAFGLVPPLLLVAVVISILADTFPHGRFVVPSVDAPRDVAAVADDPCRALSAVTLVRLGYLPSGRSGRYPLHNEPQCEWRSSTGDFGNVTLRVSRGFGDFALAYRYDHSVVSEPREFADLPAIESRLDVRSFSCAVTVGVGGDDAVVVTAFTELDPCARARAATEALVDRLPRR